MEILFHTIHDCTISIVPSKRIPVVIGFIVKTTKLLGLQQGAFHVNQIHQGILSDKVKDLFRGILPG